MVLRTGSEVERLCVLILMPTQNWLMACLDGTEGLWECVSIQQSWVRTSTKGTL